MARTSGAVRNVLLGVTVGFVAGTALGDRRTGLKAGLALGALGGVVAYLVADDEDGTTEHGIDRVTT